MLLPRLFRRDSRLLCALNSRSGKKERISRLFRMHSNKQNPKEAIGCGDIGAGVGFKDIRTGDTLYDENAPIVLEAMEFPDPAIGIAVEPKTRRILTSSALDFRSLPRKTRHSVWRPMRRLAGPSSQVWVSFTLTSSSTVCVVSSR